MVTVENKKVNPQDERRKESECKAQTTKPQGFLQGV